MDRHLVFAFLLFQKTNARNTYVIQNLKKQELFYNTKYVYFCSILNNTYLCLCHSVKKQRSIFMSEMFPWSHQVLGIVRPLSGEEEEEEKEKEEGRASSEEGL